MTLIGKSFTFIIFILSGVFMACALFVNASHRNWKDVVLSGVDGRPGLRSQIEELERVNQQLRDSEERIQSAIDREQASRKTALASLQTELDQSANDLRESESRVQSLTAEVNVLAQTNADRARELERLTNENINLRQAVRKEQQDRDEQFKQTLVLTDEATRLRGFKQQLEERNKQLAEQVTRFEEVIAANGIDINAPLDGAPPERNGVVLAVSRARNLVEVSIGADEGLREGHFLEATRSGRYVGKLRVRDTLPDRAVAEILVDYSEGILREGDRVDTTLD